MKRNELMMGPNSPFSIHQSSCSNRKPKDFSWVKEGCTSLVIFDIGIPGESFNKVLYNPESRRYGWVCESKSIYPDLRKEFENEELFNHLMKSYDAIFTCDKELVNKHENIHFCFAGSNMPWIPEQDYKIHEKTKLMSFISSNKKFCDGHRKRHELFEKIKTRTNKDTAIDVYGGIIGHSFGYKPGCHLEGYPDAAWHDKSPALNDYMFSITMENDVYDTYFTEKLTDCFATGTIPVYYGTRSVGDYFNTDGIIFLENDVESMYNTISQLSPSMYYSRMDAIKDNFERVKKLKSADDMLFENICKLGEK